MNQAPKIAVITGPTATGKTALGVMLAQELDGEVLSADSMQIYRDMDIGTAKASREEMQGVPHHMLDVADPRESFSVALYAARAEDCIQDILRRGKLPILVGGTGLYIDTLISGRSFAGGEPSEELRSKLNEKYEALGGEKLLEELSAVDPERAEKLHPSDKKRIVRALEVFYSTGKTISRHDMETKLAPPRYDACIIALSFADRAMLYRRIDSRVDKMVSAGLFGEVQGLLDRGVSPGSTAMQAIGYKETVLALRGEISTEEAISRIKQESRRYAKRQLTWLRRNPDARWILWQDEPDFARGRLCSTDYLQSHGLK